MMPATSSCRRTSSPTRRRRRACCRPPRGPARSAPARRRTSSRDRCAPAAAAGRPSCGTSCRQPEAGLERRRHHARRDVRRALPDEIARGIGVIPVRVGKRGRDPRALDQGDERQRQRGEHERRHQPQLRELGRGQRARNDAQVAQRRDTPQPSTAAAADVRITATTSPSDLSGVRSSATMSTIVATPMASDWACSSPGCASVLNARTIRLPPLAA